MSQAKTCSVIGCGRPTPYADWAQCEAHNGTCARCGAAKEPWQVYCGAACSAQRGRGDAPSSRP